MKYRITRHESTGGYVGAIDMPLEDLGGQVSAIAIGRTKHEALQNAAHIARRMAMAPGMTHYLPDNAAARCSEVCADLGDLEDAEVGILPFLMLAAKYGPGIAKAAQKANKARKAAKAAKRAAEEARQQAEEIVDAKAQTEAPSDGDSE